MPLPPSVTLVTVTGPVDNPVTGGAGNGTVTFAMPYPLRTNDGHVVGNSPPYVATLVNGAMPPNFKLPATDNPAVSPQGWLYTVQVETDVWEGRFQCAVPSSPSSVTFSSLVPVVTPPAVAVYVLLSQVGAASGVAPLGSDGKVPAGYLPSGAGVLSVTAADSTITIGGTVVNPTVGVNAIPESKVTSLVADLAGKAPTARLIGSGTGLSGGGDLSADRTLAVLYGSTAGTAAQGNDSRLSDARTPLPHAHVLDLYPPSAAGIGEWSVDPLFCGSSWPIASGLLVLIRVHFRQAMTVDEIGFAVTQAGDTPGAYSGVAVYADGAGSVSRLAQSADAGTAFTSTGTKSVALTSSVVVPAGEYRRVGILWQGSTAPRIAGTGGAFNEATANLGVRRTTFVTGQTEFPASLDVSTMSLNNVAYLITAKDT